MQCILGTLCCSKVRFFVFIAPYCRIIISGSIKNYDSSHHNTVSIFVTDSLGETEFFKILEPDSTGQFSITVPAAIQFEDDHYTVSALYMPLLLDYEGYYT